jgi:hypothetical protein
MRTAFQVFSVMVFVAGLVFFLQGINVLPGSYMTGDPQWAINGGIMMIIGISIFIWVRRVK